eukprot:scaffold435351_cov38-Prasinocladus_malaysianus.AAC.1
MIVLFNFWRALSILNKANPQTLITNPKSTTESTVSNHRQTTSEARCSYYAGIAVTGANSNMPRQSESSRHSNSST